MAKKKPERLNSKTVLELGRNSNEAGYEASLKAIYNQPEKHYGNAKLTEVQVKMLKNLRKNLGFTYQQ